MAEVSMASILDDEAPAELKDETPVVEQTETDPIVRETSAKDRLKAKEEEARAEGEGKVRDPATGKFIAKPAEEAVEVKVEVKAEVKPDELTAKEKAFLAQAQDERRKRQELENKLKSLEKPAEPEKTFWDDPEKKVADMEARMQQSEVRTRLHTAEIIARQRHPDFDAKLVVFQELVSQNPGIVGEWLRAPDPAEYAHKLATNHLALKEAGNIDALLAKREAETRAKVKAELEAEYKAKSEKAAKEREALTPSLSDARGTPVSRQTWNGPPSMDEILKH